MATKESRRKLAAVSRETQEHPRISQSQNTFFPGITQEKIILKQTKMMFTNCKQYEIYCSDRTRFVLAIFSATILHSLVLRDACFRMKITLGVVIFRTLLCAKCVSRADPEKHWTSGLNRNSSSWEKSPTFRLSVLLNSFESFFVTRPSTSSDACVIYFFCDLGTLVFCARLLPRCSSQTFLLNVAGFRLFLRVAILYGKNKGQQLRLTYLFVKEINLYPVKMKVAGKYKIDRLLSITVSSISNFWV